MIETSARLLRLLSMLQARRSWSGRDLVERLEVTDRTLRRDIERLRALGYPVHSAAGTGGGYSLGAGASLPPLMVDDDECLAIVVALQTAAGTSAVAVEDASLRALAKLERVLPSRLRRRLKSLQSSILPLAAGGPVIGMGAVALLAMACSESRAVQFRYRDLQGKETNRTIEPYRIAHFDRRWYLIGWGGGANAWETLRIDRIEAPISLGGAFARRSPPSDDIPTYVSSSVASGWGIPARILLHAPIEEARNRIPVSSGRFEAIDERTCRLHTSGTSLEVIAAWMGAFCCDFEIEDPPELAKHVADVAERLSRAARRRSARASRRA